MTTEAFSRNVSKLLSELKLVTDNLLTMLAIDLGLHGSWQNFYLQRRLSEYNRNVANKNFANYREVQDLSPMLYM